MEETKTNKTCGTCEFRFEDQCRRFPPAPIHMQTAALSLEVLSRIVSVYPPITMDDPGCGEHKATEAMKSLPHEDSEG